MASASDLPIELHAEIVKCLHHFKDRRTLLSTALVNKDWCKGSQRILFGTFTDHCYGNYDNLEQGDRVKGMHMQFLQTIAEYPQRLGPLVHSYAQDSMASNPASMEFSVRETSNYDLWRLTAKALPAMINLKHLYLEPASERWPAIDDWVSSSTLLRSFNFQLETLIWLNFYHPHNGLSDFLRTQNNLIHLENGHYMGDHNLPWLADGLCPRLISVSGGYGSLIHIARRRKIIAWKCDTDSVTNMEELPVWQDSSALDSLKYLSVCVYQVFRAIVGPLNLNIVLLELTEGYWKIDTIASLANMPNLRVLVVIQGTYRTVTDQQITKSAVECFGRLPSLKYMVLRTLHQSGNELEYRYMKLSLAPDSTDDLLREELGIDYDVGAVWWTLYNV